MSEVWKPIPGFDKYEVSNEGRVRSFAYGKNNPKLLKPFDRTGNPNVNLRKNGKLNPRPIQQLVFNAFCGGVDERVKIRHIDGDKHNCNAENLVICSRCDNCSLCKKCTLWNVSVGSGRAKSIILLDSHLNFIASYKTISAAAKELGVTREGVAVCCRKGSVCHTIKGYYVLEGTKEDFDNKLLDLSNIKKFSEKKNRKIARYSKEGVLLEVFDTFAEASEKTGASIFSIRYYTANHRLSTDNYYWRFLYNRDQAFVFPPIKAKTTQCEKSRKKPIIQTTLNKEFVSEYANSAEAEKITGFPKTNIINCCAKRAKSSKGYHWYYKDEWEANLEASHR